MRLLYLSVNNINYWRCYDGTNKPVTSAGSIVWGMLSVHVHKNDHNDKHVGDVGITNRPIPLVNPGSSWNFHKEGRPVCKHPGRNSHAAFQLCHKVAFAAVGAHLHTRSIDCCTVSLFLLLHPWFLHASCSSGVPGKHQSTKCSMMCLPVSRQSQIEPSKVCGWFMLVWCTPLWKLPTMFLSKLDWNRIFLIDLNPWDYFCSVLLRPQSTIVHDKGFGSKALLCYS